MRALFLTPFVPYPPVDGGRVRILQLMRAVARRHDVELLTLSSGPDDREAVAALREEGFPTEAVEGGGSRVVAGARALLGRRSFYGARYRSAALARSLADRLEAGRHDVVQAEYAYMGAYRPVGAAGRSVRWLLDEHNVEFDLNRTIAASGEGGLAYHLYARRELPLRRREELAACAAADRVLAVSEEDAAVLRTAEPELDVAVVPNGVDLGFFRPDGEASGGEGAVFVGKMDYRPNADGAAWFCREVLPLVRERLPGFGVKIVGHSPVPAVRELGDIDGVEVTGAVEDTRPYLRGALVVVVPLRAGSGTRLKVLEAFAMGRPVVSTTLGAEGIDAADGEHLRLADDPRGFADRVVELAGSPEERARLAAAGRRLAEKRYGWDAIGDRLADLYESA